MGIMDFIKGELLEVIEWTDDSRDTLSWRFPDEDKAIKNGAQLIVRESQTAREVWRHPEIPAATLKSSDGRQASIRSRPPNPRTLDSGVVGA